MDTAHAFLDTNTFLHYVPPDQIDWLDELGCRRAVLVVAPVVIRELNEKKDTDGPRKLRHRASAALRRLEGYSERPVPVMIREGVELRFHAREPQIDFPSRGLSRYVSDDWLIASILDYSASPVADRVLLVTQDFGLRLKANTHGVGRHKLSDKHLLPEEDDPAQKRIRELEEEVRRYAHRIPALKLTFDGEANHFRAELMRPPRLRDEMLSLSLAEVRTRTPKLDTASFQPRSFLDVPPKSEEIEEYNRKLDGFYERYRKYLLDLDEFSQSRGRRFKLGIVLVNEGSSPAENIDVYMLFPDGLDVFEEEGLDRPPEEPRAPAPPMSALESMRSALSGVSLGAMIRPELSTLLNTTPIVPRLSNVSGPRIRKTNSYEVESNVRELKHNFMTQLGTFHISFSSWEAVKSFSIQYSLFASNVPEVVKGELHVICEVEG